MPYTKETVDGKTMMKIDASLTIYDAHALHEAFINCFEKGAEMAVDVGEVAECDAAGIQLLCAACKDARENRQSFQVLGTSKAVMDTLQRLGMNADEIL